MTLKIKLGVKFEKDSLALGKMLATLLTLDHQGEIVITSGSDGTHMAGSRHYVGEAIDLRRWNISDVPGFIAKLSKALGPKFIILDEHDHLHVQVKRGQKYA